MGIQDKVITAFSDGAKQVEESLKCPLCRGLFREAMLAPCCGASFCNGCAIERLCHHGATDSLCPHCSKSLMAHQLIPNNDLRAQVDAVFKASTKEKKIEAEVAQRKLETPIYSFTKKGRGSTFIYGGSASSTGATDTGEIPAPIETVDLSRPPNLRNLPAASTPIPPEYISAKIEHSSEPLLPSLSAQAAMAKSSLAASSTPPIISTSDPEMWQFPPVKPATAPLGLIDPRQLTTPNGVPFDGRPLAPIPTMADPRSMYLSQPVHHPQASVVTEVAPAMLSEEDFKLLQNAWRDYYAHQQRKAKRRVNREARAEKRAKKLKKMEEQLAREGAAVSGPVAVVAS